MREPSVDEYVATLRIQKARTIRRRRVPSDENRRWKILQYLYERGAISPETAITSGEISSALGLSPSNCSGRLKRMRGKWVCRVDGRRGGWFLTNAALKFAERYGGFLNHPWIKRKGNDEIAQV